MVKRSLVRRAIASQAEAVRYLNAPGEVIHYIICKGAVNDEPVYADELFLPHAFFPDVNDMEVCGIHFFEMIQEHSTRRLEKILQTIELGRVRADAAQVLGIKEGATVLLFHRLVIGVDGGPIAYRKITSNGTKYKFLTEFERIR